MILAALIDAGADLSLVNKTLSKLPFEYVHVSVVDVNKRGLRAASLQIESSPLTLRTYREVRAAVAEADFDEAVERRALSILENLASAEARVHGGEIDEVHFHELSAADTIIDVVGVAAALESLQVDDCIVGQIATGGGVIDSEHGTIPNPGPAVTELLTGLPLTFLDTSAELITPTGAAIIATIASGYSESPTITIDSVGYGAGTRDLEIPNVMRVLVGTPRAERLMTTDEVQIEANIDDMSPEIYEHVMQMVFAAGAVDVWITPIIGKKGRPAQIIAALAPAAFEPAIREVLVSETSTIGVRSTRVSKWMLERRWETVEVEGRQVRIKIALKGDQVVNVAPEYADCVEVALATGLPLKEVFAKAIGARERI